MEFLSDTDKQRIREAVEAAEKQTSGEFVTVIARQADRYLFIPTLWAAVISLLEPGFLLFVAPMLDYQQIYTSQLATFLILSLLFRWQALTISLIPKGVKYRRAARLAREQFFAQGLQNTKLQNGVLLFVSVAERYVEVIADKGINDKVDQSEWDDIISDFVKKVRNQEVANGFVDAIHSCSRLLETHFPYQENDKNELSDHLVLLD